MDKRPELDDAGLDALFAAARRDAPGPSDDLMARILADAQAVTDAAEAPVLRPAPRASVWQGILDAIGGWPAAAGLMTATVAGLAVGLGATETLEPLTGLLTGYEIEDFMPAYAGLLSEG